MSKKNLRNVQQISLKMLCLYRLNCKTDTKRKQNKKITTKNQNHMKAWITASATDHTQHLGLNEEKGAEMLQMLTNTAMYSVNVSYYQHQHNLTEVAMVLYFTAVVQS